MVRGRNVELGNLPLYVLIAGLGLLQFQILRDGAPTYIIVGNGVALGFNLVNLGWVISEYFRVRRAGEMRLRETARYTLTKKGRKATQ